jgi:hypothetical protein
MVQGYTKQRQADKFPNCVGLVTSKVLLIQTGIGSGYGLSHPSNNDLPVR